MVTAQQVIAYIGQLPVGDPTAIRAHAARIEADASNLVASSAHVMREVAATGFEGPAANRWRQEMEACDRDARRTAGELTALAARMRATAGRVESQQAQWHRDFARVKARLEQAVRDGLR